MQDNELIEKIKSLPPNQIAADDPRLVVNIAPCAAANPRLAPDA